jgi:hypothetical protein
MFKHYTGIGQNSQIRVTIKTNTTDSALEMISIDAMTWDECFAGLFPGRSVARVFLHLNDAWVLVRSPHMLNANDGILIEFD